MKVKILSEQVYGHNIQVKLQWIDDSVTPNLKYERDYLIAYKPGMTIANAKAALLDLMAEFKAERDTDARLSGFVGQTFDETQLV